MTTVDVDDSSLQADSQPNSVGLVWGSAAAWRCFTFIRWTGWILEMTYVVSSDIIGIPGEHFGPLMTHCTLVWPVLRPVLWSRLVDQSAVLESLLYHYCRSHDGSTIDIVPCIIIIIILCWPVKCSGNINFPPFNGRFKAQFTLTELTVRVDG